MNFRRWSWLAVPALGLLEWVAHAYYAAAPPTEAEWDALQPKLAELRARDELIVIAPYWAEPHARRAFGDELMPLAQVARPDDERYPRAIEVSILGQRSELEDWRVSHEESVGKFRLLVLDNPHPKPARVDFVDLLGPEQAEAFTLRKGDKREPCAWANDAKVSNGALHGHPTFPKRRFKCKAGEWHFVGVTVIEDQDYRPRRCIWLHPTSGGKTSVRFPQVELGKEIVGYGGLPWFVERERRGAPVTLEVAIDGKLSGKLVHADGEGWKRFAVDTSEFSGQKHDVEFRSHSKKPHQREFCFQADVR